MILQAKRKRRKNGTCVDLLGSKNEMLFPPLAPAYLLFLNQSAMAPS